MSGKARAVSEGRPEPLGVSLDGDGANVAVASRHAAAIMLCLFERNGEGPPVETARIPLPARTGDVFHGHVAGIEPGQLYGLRADGPFAPAQGHRFNPAKLLIDPYAKAIDGPIGYDRARTFAYVPGKEDEPDPSDSAPAIPRFSKRSRTCGCSERGMSGPWAWYHHDWP